MEINERVRYFRTKVIKMNQRAFAKCLGMKQTSISSLENGTVSEPAIKSICLAFNLNEDWLRYGTEPMYVEKTVFFSEIHERIKYFRKECLHLSQTEFGEKLGVSRSVINNIERNVLSRPDQKTSLLKLACHEFGINEDWLFNGVGTIYRKDLTINERIRILRNNLNLSQCSFAEKIGISQRAVSWSEIPGNNIPNVDIKSICMAFNVNENWLRNGIGSMYSKNKKSAASSIELDEIIDKYGISKQELEFAKSYLKLDPSFRHALLECFRNLLISPGDKVE